MNFKSFLFVFISAILSSMFSIFACFIGYKLYAPRVYCADMKLIQKQYSKNLDFEKKLKSMIGEGNSQINKMREALIETQKEIQKYADELKTIKSETQKRQLNETKILPLIKEFNSQKDLMKKYSEQVRLNMAKFSREKSAEIQKDINDEISLMASGIKASFIIDTSSNFYGSPKADISSEIIRRLNSKKGL